jgi:hypothetical protein
VVHDIIQSGETAIVIETTFVDLFRVKERAQRGRDVAPPGAAIGLEIRPRFPPLALMAPCLRPARSELNAPPQPPRLLSLGAWLFPKGRAQASVEWRETRFSIL